MSDKAHITKLLEGGQVSYAEIAKWTGHTENEIKHFHNCLIASREAQELSAETNNYRRVMANWLGVSALPKGCHVHHIDGNHRNNKLTNLCLVTEQGHYDLHAICSGRYHRKVY